MTSPAALRRQVEEADDIRAARIPLSRLRFHPANARRDLGDLRALAQSLTEDGCHQPIEVFRSGRDYVVVDGNRRLAAAQIAHLRTLPAFIVPQRAPRDQLTAMLTTDVHKKHLTPAERRAAVLGLTAEFGTAREVAARLGVSEGTVSRWRAGDGPGSDEHLGGADAPRPAPLGAGGTPGTARRQSVTPLAFRRRGVPAARVDGFVAVWSERAAGGLAAEQARELLDELTAMTAPPGAR